MDWYLKVLRNYVTFTGRARRKEFWMFTLFHFLFLFLLIFLLIYSTDNFFNDDYYSESEEPNLIIALLLIFYVLGTFLPSVAVTVRRLHDIGKSGFWYFISLVPYIGSFVLLILTCMDSQPRPNQWGENPKGIGNDRLIDQIGR
jgi:uncharacterized membrane protein YhaH (DUF805 family)